MDIYKKYYYQFNLPSSVPFHNLVNLRHLVFEVTTSCNLHCTYCGYGQFYNNRTHNNNINMLYTKAKLLLDYLFDLWKNNKNDYDIRDTIIGFYGGEPLLNFKFIESVVDYIEKHPIEGRHFGYTITTNAVLLDKYMDFFAKNKFFLVISLDGDKEANSYRVDHAGKSSYDIVVENTKKIQTKYPEYFKEYVSFNSVLTNRSDLRRLKTFMLREFGKESMVSEVNDFGILESQVVNFKKIFKSLKIETEKCKEFLLESDFAKIPQNKISYMIMKYLSGNSFASYNSLLTSREYRIFPTGTCFPFDKKMFVNAKGELFPCERINQKYSLGYITKNAVSIDFEMIAKKYSEYYKRIFSCCKDCYAKPICEQCMFYINNIDDVPSCPNFLTKKEYDNLINYHLKYLTDNPQVYQRLMREMF